LLLALAVLISAAAPLVHADGTDETPTADEAYNAVEVVEESVIDSPSSATEVQFVMPTPANQLDTVQWYKRQVYLRTVRTIANCGSWSDDFVRMEQAQRRGDVPPGTSKRYAFALTSNLEAMESRIRSLEPPPDLVSVHVLYMEAVSEWRAAMGFATTALMSDDSNALADAIAHFAVRSALVETEDRFFT
jgi:hypothetical protein